MSAGRARGTTADGLKVLWVAIRREPWMFAASTLGAALFGALAAADAWVLGWSTDHVLVPWFGHGHVGAGAFWAVVGLFAGVAILRAAGVIARRIGAGVMQYRMQAHTRRDVTRRYLELPMAWHQQHPTGELLSNANSDVEAAWAPIAPLPMAVGTMVMMVIAVVQMFLADAVLALVGVLVFPAVAVANVIFRRFTSPLMMQAQRLRGELSQVAHESFDGAMVVKTLGREAEETQRFRTVADELATVNIRAGRLQAAFDPALAALPDIGVLVVLLLGVLRATHGQVAPGDVVEVAYLLTVVSMPIRSIGWLLGQFPRSVVGWRRVSRVLEATGHLAYGERRLPYAGGADRGARLCVDGVAFSYLPDEPVLDGVAFEVAPGRTTALVGATAAGKSTLTTLLARLVDPDRGRITIDGTDLRDLAPGELAWTVAVVPQTAFLFDDTVRGNVTLGGSFSDEEVWAALETAQAADFVRALPQGLDSRLGERGTSLSGGQRQRISLARALVRRPRLLVLDDATSAVDPEVEQRILAGIRSSRGAREDGTTMVVVAYRKATIGLADEVVHLAEGRVAARGTHAELLEESPDYFRLVNAYEAADLFDTDGTDDTDGVDDRTAVRA